VRGAVAKRDEQPTEPDTPIMLLRRGLDRWRPVIENLLPPEQSPEHFIATVANAVRAVPELLRCDQPTLIGAALKAAQLGLEPNDGRNQCWILPYSGKAQFQLGYGGVLELLRRAAPGVRVQGRPVYPNDDFDVDYGADQPVKHKPAVVRGMDRGGDASAWYVLIRWPDGSQDVHVLDRAGVEYHRSFSKQPNGQMWTKSYDAAALKSVVLDMRRWLPQSPSIAAALEADEKTVVADASGITLENGPALPANEPTGEIASGGGPTGTSDPAGDPPPDGDTTQGTLGADG
jgi:recombination protein RecT